MACADAYTSVPTLRVAQSGHPQSTAPRLCLRTAVCTRVIHPRWRGRGPSAWPRRSRQRRPLQRPRRQNMRGQRPRRWGHRHPRPRYLRRPRHLRRQPLARKLVVVALPRWRGSSARRVRLCPTTCLARLRPSHRYRRPSRFPRQSRPRRSRHPRSHLLCSRSPLPHRRPSRRHLR